MKRQKDMTLNDKLPRSVGAQYATRKNEGMEPKQKQHPVVDGTGVGSKVRCYKEQYCIGDYWNAKVGSQETPGVTGKFGLGIRNEAGQRLIEFCQENALAIANTLFQQHKKRLYT